LNQFLNMFHLQDPRPEALLFLNEVTRKIKTYLNDKRIARERQRREGVGPTSRRWFAPADMWVRGAVAVESAAPEQPDAEHDEVRFRFELLQPYRSWSRLAHHAL
jgi:hypothetical protein